MKNFKEFIAQQAQKDGLPFEFDFDYISVESETFEMIGGKRINTINDLTVAESYFLELMQNQTNRLRRDFNLLVNKLAEALKTTMALETRADAIEFLVYSNPEWSEDNDYQQFQVDYAEDLSRLGEMYKILNRNFTSDMMMVTFFLMTRHDSEWTFGRTANLPQSVISDLKELIFKEARRGLDIVEDVEEAEDAEVNPDDVNAGREGETNAGK